MTKLNSSFFDQKSKIQVFAPDSVIIQPEKPLAKLYFLRKGLVRQYIVNEDGDEITIHFFRPGALFPLMILISKQPNQYYFQAVNEVEVQEFAADKTLKAIISNPDLHYEFTQKFALAIQGLSKRIQMLATKDSSSKVFLFLEYIAGQFGEKIDDKIKINFSLTHSEIASWIGVRRETVSRQLGVLQKSNLISFEKGYLTINNSFFNKKDTAGPPTKNLAKVKA